MGIFTFDRDGRITGVEEKPDAARLAAMSSGLPNGSTVFEVHESKPFIASMGIYLFSRDVLLTQLDQPGDDFGRQLIPALTRYLVSAYLYSGYWADVGTVPSFYEANIQLTREDAPFSFYDSTFPIYTHPRFLPPSRLVDCNVHHSLVAEGSYLDRCDVSDTVVGIRTTIRNGARIRESVLLGADLFEDEWSAAVPLGIGSNVLLKRVIVDKNVRIGEGARLVNAQAINHHDGDGYFIRTASSSSRRVRRSPPGSRREWFTGRSRRSVRKTTLTGRSGRSGRKNLIPL